MIQPYPKNYLEACLHACILFMISCCIHSTAAAQTCPAFSSSTISAYPNTYYPATSNVSAGSTAITLGAAGYGATPISAWDIVLIIQVQGAQINSNNSTLYGDGTGTGSGYLNNGQLMAGHMEYAVATNAVSLAGGTLNVQTGLVNAYKNANFGADGQYRYEVIRMPVYYNLKLNATITVPKWNGTCGGALVLYATDTINMNGQTIDASGAGFRGGGGKSFSGGAGANTDFRASTANTNCGAKGEGLAGTPRYIYSNGAGALLDYGAALEGYPNGSVDRGAPGNAGGGATDGDPTSNSNNAGGGGGGNGGTGGRGGRSWSSNLNVGGNIGAVFAQVSPSRLVMGGGGGAGSSDGGTGTPASGFASSGASGGGIVIITAGGISNTGTINVKGSAPNTTLANDGSGGGGAGGSVLILAGSGLSGVTVIADGSNGASNTGAGSPHGTGGGGGGGVVYSNASLNAASSANGGARGTTAGGVNYGSSVGATGILVQNILLSQAPTSPLACNMLLATESLSVSASCQNGTTIINWQSPDEMNTREYVVEKSFDGIHFSAISTVLKSPLNNANAYNYTDLPAANNHPVIYYRIKSITANGSYFFSKTIEVKPLLHITKLTVSPNPVEAISTIAFATDRNMNVSIRLVDIRGNTAWQKQYAAQTGMNILQPGNWQALPDGIYMLQLCAGTNYEYVKVFIHRN